MKPASILTILTMATASLAAPTLARAVDGLVVLQSPHTAKATLDKLEALAREKGLTIFARVDHGAGAAKVGSKLRPTEVMIFGSPKGGAPFMECAQTVGIDLPLKALAWEDAQGQAWLGYNDTAYLVRRHEVAACPAAEKLGQVLKGLASAAVAP